jgi:ABC-type metal ion transport system substrate-binding protein
LVEFSDWNTPNITLNNGDIDANFFQHQPFLDNAIKETGFKLKRLLQVRLRMSDCIPKNIKVLMLSKMHCCHSE